MLTDVANDKVSVGDFLSEYSGLLIQSHGKVSEDDIEDNLDDDCAEDDHEEEEEEEEEHKVDSEQKIPFHFEILIKVFFLNISSLHFIVGSYFLSPAL